MTNRFKPQDKAIIFICGVLIAICWWLIMNPRYLQNEEAKGQKIGRISVEGPEVRKKISSEYFWKDIKNKNDLHYGDAVFAGGGSSAFVKFNDGTSLNLSENSLVKFENKKNSLSIDLAFGHVQVDSKAKFITIKDCGQEIQVESNAAKFDIDRGKECGDVQFKVKSGSVKVANKSIGAGAQLNSLNLNQRGSLAQLIKNIEKPRIKSPQNVKAQIQRLKSGGLEFTADWDAVVKAAEYELVISSDSEMRNGRKTYSVKANKFAVAVESEKVYYQLRANESAEQLGEFSSIGFAQLKEYLAPPQIKLTQFRMLDFKKLSLSLGWSPLSEASQYRVEISETPDFAKSLGQTVTGVQARFLNLEQTFVYARVRAENKFIKSEYSAPVLISFKYNAQNHKVKVFSKKCMVKSQGEAGAKEEFSVNWKPVPMAQKYVVKVVDPSKAAEVSQLHSREPASSITVPGCGEYDVKVEAYDKSDRKISSEFNASKVIYKSTLALLKPMISEANKNMNIFVQKGVAHFIWLKWLGDKKADSIFKVEIATDINFTQNYKQYRVKDNKLLLKNEFKNGQYFWRVRTHSADLDSDWSDLGMVKVTLNKATSK